MHKEPVTKDLSTNTWEDRALEVKNKTSEDRALEVKSVVACRIVPTRNAKRMNDGNGERSGQHKIEIIYFADKTQLMKTKIF
ncbi:MAG: hypothetical protein HYY37_04240 [Candidatus Aenigmarchaeota archaeon]|nr:hypothetical protein [Candidatus Aenigmarchaeota archaeon]